MAQSETKDLGYLGENFQQRLIHAFMEDGDFFTDLVSIIDQNMFTNVIMRTYVGFMKDYYQKYEVAPSYNVMNTYLRDKIRNPIDLESALTFNEELQKLDTEAIDYIRDTSTRFFKQQNIVRVANEILKIVGNGNTDKYDECAELVSQAVNVGIQENFGSTVFDNIEDTLSDDYRVPIPTGISKLDETLEGGLGKGELGLIIAPSGTGKSSMTTAMAAHAATHGFKVVQIVFEDRIKQIQRKHIGRITDVEARNLSKSEYIEYVKEKLSSYADTELLKNNLKIVRFPTGEITASYIEHYIKKLINKGFKPDLIIVDYFECLNHVGDKSMTEWEKEGKTMRKFEALAGKYDIAFWIPTQGSRDSISSEVVTMDKAGGSLKKVQIAHIILSIARSNEDVANNRATLALLKNRAGCSGKIWNNVYFNNGTCIINTDDVDEFDNMLVFGNNHEEDVKKMQKDLLRELKNKSK